MERQSLRDRLTANHLSYAWLINIMKMKGYETDKSTVSSAVNGTISGDRVTKIINLGHEIIDEYEKDYIGSVNQ